MSPASASKERAAKRDERMLRAALAAARRGDGRVFPNPSVGAVIYRGDRVLGRGTTQPPGGRHAEIMAIEALGLVEVGKGGQATAKGETAIGGRIPVNTSGGLKSKGHPVGATGVAQICEITEQLRGESGERQVKDARRGLAQNMGGTCASSVVHILEVA